MIKQKLVITLLYNKNNNITYSTNHPLIMIIIRINFIYTALFFTELQSASRKKNQAWHVR